MWNKIKKAIKEPKKILLYLCNFKVYNWIPDRPYLKFIYWLNMGKKLSLNPPVTFNEKIQWLKLYDRKPSYTTMVDKYEAKKYVADRIGEEHIVPNFGVWNSFDEIDFEALPDQFVLKCTHDCGGLVIVRDKAKLDMQSARKKIEASLKRNYFWQGREWPYKNVAPRIIAEKFLDENITDYKFFCFNGEPKCLYLSRGLEDHATAEISFFDLEFNRLPFGRSDYKQYKKAPEIPENFEEMLSIAKTLAKEFPFVRVDLYNVGAKIYFSELTFHPCSGYMPFDPEKYDEIMGSYLDLEV